MRLDKGVSDGMQGNIGGGVAESMCMLAKPGCGCSPFGTLDQVCKWLRPAAGCFVVTVPVIAAMEEACRRLS